MSKIWWLVLTGWLAISLGAFGQRESARDAKPAGEALWRVTDWPAADPEQEDLREIEAHLNRMAGEGWRFHSQINGHRTNMLGFV